MNYVYHVTYLKDLPGIRRKGLRSGSGSTFGGGYTGYSTGKLFLTSWEGVEFWFNKYAELAEGNSDNLIEDGYIPIVLSTEDFERADFHKDAPGSRDALAESYYIDYPLTDSILFAYDGSGWEAIDDIDDAGITDEAVANAEEDTDDGETWLIPNFDFLLPDSEE